MSDALAVALQSHQQSLAAKASGIDDIIPDAVDDAVLRTGTETVAYPGEFKRVQISGGGAEPGNIYAPQLINVHPESFGVNGKLDKIPGTGYESAQGSIAKTGRYAKNEHDTPRVFPRVSRSSLAVMSWNHTNAVRVDGLVVTVPIASGVSAYIEAESCVECAGQSSSTALELLIQIGSDASQGAQSDRYAESKALGQPFVTGNSTQWHQPTFTHGRQLRGTDADETTGVEVFVRVRAFSGGSGGAPPQTPAKFVIGNTWRCNSDSVNIRATASTSASINGVMSFGMVGTIIGGPAFGSGLKWWQVTCTSLDPDVSGWVAEQYLDNTTPAAPPQETTNRIRSGWLLVRRFPI